MRNINSWKAIIIGSTLAALGPKNASVEDYGHDFHDIKKHNISYT